MRMTAEFLKKARTFIFNLSDEIIRSQLVNQPAETITIETEQYKIIIKKYEFNTDINKANISKATISKSIICKSIISKASIIKASKEQYEEYSVHFEGIIDNKKVITPSRFYLEWKNNKLKPQELIKISSRTI